MLNSDECKILGRFKAEAERIFGDGLDRIVLFGSRSRGDAGPDADFDLLVIVQCLLETDRKKVFEIAADLSREYGTVLDVLVVPIDDFTEDHHYLYENVQKEGQVV